MYKDRNYSKDEYNNESVYEYEDKKNMAKTAKKVAKTGTVTEIADTETAAKTTQKATKAKSKAAETSKETKATKTALKTKPVVPKEPTEEVTSGPQPDADLTVRPASESNQEAKTDIKPKPKAKSKAKTAPVNIDRANLSKMLKAYFGFDTFKGDQEAIIVNVMTGNDTFVLMPTGGGKSLCYQLPSLLMEGVAIVISPLIALMKNQVDAIRNYSEEDGVAHFINSSLNKSAIDQVKEDIVSGKTKLLYVAPESLTKEENVEFLRSVKISFYAIDEAHCISEWGHDFRPEYRKIRPIIDQIGRAPIIALTATATNKVRDDIKKNLGIVSARDYKSSFNRANLYYEVRPKTKNVDRDIICLYKIWILYHTSKCGNFSYLLTP